MYRSISWSRVADDYFMHTSPKMVPGLRTPSPFEVDEQAVYDPVEEIAKTEKSRIKFAENAVHVIPFVLLLCAFILWLFSNPNVEVGLINKADPVTASVEGLTIEGDIDTDSVDGTQTSILPVELGDMDKPKLPERALRQFTVNRFK